MVEDKFTRLALNFPKVFNPFSNPGIKAVLMAFAAGDNEASTQIANTKNQIFVKTAEGAYLDRLSSGLGVQRPPLLGISDDDFRNLIVDLSLKPKQIRRTFYDILDTFWGVLYSRANVNSQNAGPFNVHTGDTLIFSIDAGMTLTAKALVGDIANPGAATADEIATIINRQPKVTASVIVDQITGNETVNIRTNTPGPLGSVNIIGGTMSDVSEVNFKLGIVKITDLPQRTVIYEINNKEIIIELPATVPILRRVLRGSHHFHETEAIEPPNPISGASWVGSFFYDPTGVNYTVTSERAIIQEPLVKGQVYTKVTVDDASGIPDMPGFLIADWGLGQEEQPIKYIGRPNDNTILLSPDYTFSKTHLAGAYLNVLSQLTPLVPTTNGSDYPIYITDPTGARELVQTLLIQLAAAGVIVTFDILLPTYRYLRVNPYK